MAKDLRAGLITPDVMPMGWISIYRVDTLTEKDIVPETEERIDEAIRRQGNERISKINRRDDLK